MRKFTHIPCSGLVFLATLQFLGVAQASNDYQENNYPTAWGQPQSKQPTPTPEHYSPPQAEHQQPAYGSPSVYGQDNSPSVVTVVQTEQVHVTETMYFTETLYSTDVSAKVMYVTEIQSISATQTEHVTVYNTAIETLPPVQVTITESAFETILTTLVSLATETLVHTMVVTSVVPSTVAQMVQVTNTVEKIVTQIYAATATATETATVTDLVVVEETLKLTETAVVTHTEVQVSQIVSVQVQVSHIVQTQVSTQVLVLEKTESATVVVNKVETETATQVIHSVSTQTKVATETEVFESVATETATQVIHSVATETQVATETMLVTETQVIGTETKLTTETQVIYSVATETKLATETVLATETQVINSAVIETVYSVATETAVLTTQPIHSIATETKLGSVASVAAETLTMTKNQLLAQETVHMTIGVTTTVPCVTPSPMTGGGMVRTVIVGGDAGLAYTPSEIIAEVGDIVNFVFMKQNHTATQSTFGKPCNKLSVDAPDSGFLANINNTVVPPPAWNYTVISKDPTWWYCKQRIGAHCGKGMVFAINPTCEETFKSFQDAAIALNGTVAATSVASSPPSAVGTSAAATHTVFVGGDAGLVYSPSEIIAVIGDIVHFVFMKQNHTVTQSTFDKPCSKMSADAPDSGFMTNVNNTAVPAPIWDYTVTSTDPTWWYCKQRTGTHCGKGMVFAINPTTEETFAKFKEAAIALNGTVTSTATATTAATAAATATTTTTTTQASAIIATGISTLPTAGGSCACQCLCPPGSFSFGVASNHPAFSAAPLSSAPLSSAPASVLASTLVTKTKSGLVSAIQPTPVLVADPVLSSSTHTTAAVTKTSTASTLAPTLVLNTTTSATAAATEAISTESATIAKTTIMAGTTTMATGTTAATDITSTAKATKSTGTTSTQTNATTTTQAAKVTGDLSSSLMIIVPPVGEATTSAATGSTQFLPINFDTADLTNLHTGWTGQIKPTSS